MSKLSDNIERKFVDTIDVDEWEVETDTGWKDIKTIQKTVEYEVYHIILENGLELKCADDHIIFDEYMNEIFVKDCIPNQTQIQTKFGLSKVLKVENLQFSDNMYDIEIDDENHRYYSNDILSHNTITMAAYMLWCILFKPYYRIAILANKESSAKNVLSQIKLAYEHIPVWMQQGVEEWNMKSIKLENESEIITAGTSKSGIRGRTANFLYLDEFAHVEEHVAHAFFESVFPVIASGTTTKTVISSTPNGLNYFYKIWSNSEKGKNNYKRVDVKWNEPPGRDEKWKKDIIDEHGEEYFRREFMCQFLGSSNTLINSDKLKELADKEPIFDKEGLKIYNKPKSDHDYIAVVDVSEGIGMDFSTISVIDITNYPYKQVATYRNNMISPILFPEIILNLAKTYNDSMVLIEVNNIGSQIAKDLYMDLGYENILMTKNNGRGGQQISGGFASNVNYGLKMTTATKRIGCSNLKTLIENDKLIIQDLDTILELLNFVQIGTSYEADAGMNDDMVMGLVIFSWLVNQQYFKDLTSQEIRKRLLEDRASRNNEEPPMGFYDDGLQYAENFYKSIGDI